MRDQLIMILTYARGMWRYRWYALILTWIICLSGWIWIYTLPDVYKATTRVQVDTQSALTPLLQGLAVNTDIMSEVSIVVKLLKSSKSLEAVIDETELSKSVVTFEQKQAMINTLRKNLHIFSPRRNNNLITIEYGFTQPHIAKQVVEKVLNNLVEGTRSGSRTDKKKAQDFLVEQIKEYERRLTHAEQTLAEFKQKNVGMLPEQGVGYYGRLQGAMDNKEKLESELKIAKNKRSVLQKQLQGELPATTGESAIDKQILTHMTELDTMLLKFTEQHPDVVAKKEIIQQLQLQKKQEQARRKNQDLNQGSDETGSITLNPVYSSAKIALQDVEVEIRGLESQLYEQNQKIKKLNSLVDTIPEVEAKLIRLNRDYQVVKTQHETLLQRLESAKLTEEVDKTADGIKFQIVEPPNVPFEPSGPNRIKYLSLVLLIGVGAGLGLMFVLLQLRPVYITSTEIMNDLELPVFGAAKIKWNDIQKSKLKLELTTFASVSVLLLLFFFIFLIFNDSGSYYLQSLYRSDIGAFK